MEIDQSWIAAILAVGSVLVSFLTAFRNKGETTTVSAKVEVMNQENRVLREEMGHLGREMAVVQTKLAACEAEREDLRSLSRAFRSLLAGQPRDLSDPIIPPDSPSRSIDS